MAFPLAIKISGSTHTVVPTRVAETIREASGRAIKRDSMVMVAPGVWRNMLPSDPPEIVLGEYRLRADGNYDLVPISDRWVRLTTRVCALLGFGEHHQTLYRLGRAGFIELVRAAPNCFLLNLVSFYNHLRRCAEHGGDMWSKDDAEGRKRLKQYMDNFY